jgi:hypothetical protein
MGGGSNLVSGEGTLVIYLSGAFMIFPAQIRAGRPLYLKGSRRVLLDTQSDSGVPRERDNKSSQVKSF